MLHKRNRCNLKWKSIYISKYQNTENFSNSTVQYKIHSSRSNNPLDTGDDLENELKECQNLKAENEHAKLQKIGEKQAKQKELADKLLTLRSVEQKETQIKHMERELKTLRTNILNKESTLNSQNGKGRKQELHADRLRDVRKLVDTNRLILNEVQESVKCTVRYVVHWYFVSKIDLTYCGKKLF